MKIYKVLTDGFTRTELDQGIESLLKLTHALPGGNDGDCIGFGLNYLQTKIGPCFWSAAFDEQLKSALMLKTVITGRAQTPRSAQILALQGSGGLDPHTRKRLERD